MAQVPESKLGSNYFNSPLAAPTIAIAYTETSKSLIASYLNRRRFDIAGNIGALHTGHRTT
jgi:hypothetical protein